MSTRTSGATGRLLLTVLLTLGVVAAAVAGPAVVAPTTVTAQAAASTWTVAKGDTLSSIGRATGVAWQTIASLNGITSPWTIRVGQVLRLRATSAYKAPAFAAKVPAGTSQVVRTVRTDRWCSQRYCTVTQLWSRSGGQWRLQKSFRSQIGPNGFIDGTKRVAGDKTTPAGVYGIATTFSTDSRNPGVDFRWKQRRATSTVSGSQRYYNTWIEEPGRTDGDRRSMRWGLWIGYNNPRLVPGKGPAPDQRRGSGIFMHTMGPSARYAPSAGCVAIGDPEQMKQVLLWLDEESNPRIVTGI